MSKSKANNSLNKVDKEYPCLLEFQNHNHRSDVGEALRTRPLGEDTKKAILELFQRGHSVAFAYHTYCTTKMEELGDEYSDKISDRHYFPTKTDVRTLWTTDFICTGFERYYQQRILDIVLKRESKAIQERYLPKQLVENANLKDIGNHQYEVTINTLTLENKILFYQIATGKEPKKTLFCPLQSPGTIETSFTPELISPNEVDPSTIEPEPLQEINVVKNLASDIEATKTAWLEYSNTILQHLKNDPEQFLPAVNRHLDNFKKYAISVPSLISGLYTSYKYKGSIKIQSGNIYPKIVRRGVKISVQPTAVSRRKIKMCGKRKLVGRPSFSSKKSSVRAPHSLNLCVENNRGLGSNKAIKSYFSSDGIEYNLGRVPIGCSDFSTHGYSYDDSSFPDPQLNGFNLVPEDIVYKIPIIKEANRLTNDTLHLMGVSWTSPKWMKVIPEYIAMFGEIKRDMFQSWADYHVKFLDAYDDNNITFWGITTGNEPSIGYTPVVIPIVAFTAPLLKSKNPKIEKSKNPKIQKSKQNFRNEIPLTPTGSAMFENKGTEDYIDGIAVHWYFDKISPPSVLDDTHNKYPDKFLIMTEACRGQIPFEKKVDLGSWDRAEDIAGGVIENFKHWVTGWVDWNMALNEGGGPSYVSNYVDSPIIVNSSSQEFYKQPMFYALGHFSKFIPRGSIRIDVSQFSSDTQTIAFKRPDGGVAIIILNK
ncbi:unnamed protein product [Psylliodes chrysocephalus]|uniref:Glucosylceramidase n=1 Tax=Psylliodes chrysocephalus TaxID=3402493 RepID=A0A9P0CUA2_9CUCU|nr:unnamed protein product [Psylliodes chrysocephala]